MTMTNLSASQIAQIQKTTLDNMGETVSVRTYLDAGAHGPNYADPVDVVCLMQWDRQMKAAPGGEEVIAPLTIAAAHTDEAIFAVGSRVTAKGRTSTVLDVHTLNYRDNVLLVEVTCG